MTRIYTRTGDEGDTGLFGGGRVHKDEPRVEAYGEVDELNAAIGLARAEGLGELDVLAHAIQEQLFCVGSVLATPPGVKAAAVVPPIEPAWIEKMERAIDTFELELPELKAFILPGGSKAGAALHLARTICRRAERRVVPLARAGQLPREAVVYLNRLSDLLFTMARVANHRAKVKDEPWAIRSSKG